jgi:hypothetical protein
MGFAAAEPSASSIIDGCDNSDREPIRQHLARRGVDDNDVNNSMMNSLRARRSQRVRFNGVGLRAGGS